MPDRFGPRVVCVSGMVLIATGLLGTSVADSMPMVYVAYGVCIGLGIALVYTPAIGCVQPWFTRRRGLASGIASAGIGAGTLVVPEVRARTRSFICLPVFSRSAKSAKPKDGVSLTAMTVCSEGD